MESLGHWTHQSPQRRRRSLQFPANSRWSGRRMRMISPAAWRRSRQLARCPAKGSSVRHSHHACGEHARGACGVCVVGVAWRVRALCAHVGGGHLGGDGGVSRGVSVGQSARCRRHVLHQHDLALQQDVQETAVLPHRHDVLADGVCIGIHPATHHRTQHSARMMMRGRSPKGIPGVTGQCAVEAESASHLISS